MFSLYKNILFNIFLFRDQRPLETCPNKKKTLKKYIFKDQLTGLVFTPTQYHNKCVKKDQWTVESELVKSSKPLAMETKAVGPIMYTLAVITNCLYCV